MTSACIPLCVLEKQVQILASGSTRVHSGKLAPLMIVERAQLSAVGRLLLCSQGLPYFLSPFRSQEWRGEMQPWERGWKNKSAQRNNKTIYTQNYVRVSWTVYSSSLRPVHTTPEKFENGGFTLKTHQMLSHHTAPEKFENATITGHFGFVFQENSGREISRLSWRHRFRKTPFSKCFPSALKRKAGVFKFRRFEARFREVLFSWDDPWEVAMVTPFICSFPTLACPLPALLSIGTYTLFEYCLSTS